MTCNIDPLVDLDCPTFNQAFIDWLNTLKNNQIAQNLCIEAIVPSSITLLDTPLVVLNQEQQRSNGTFDSGDTAVNINAISAIPVGATAAILRVSTGVNGQNDPAEVTEPDLFSYAHIEVAKTNVLLNGGNFFSPGSVPTLVSYSDTNVARGDDNNSTDIKVALNGNNISYRAKIRFDNTDGIDTGWNRIYLVGYI